MFAPGFNGQPGSAACGFPAQDTAFGSLLQALSKEYEVSLGRCQSLQEENMQLKSLLGEQEHFRGGVTRIHRGMRLPVPVECPLASMGTPVGSHLAAAKQLDTIFSNGHEEFDDAEQAACGDDEHHMQ